MSRTTMTESLDTTEARRTLAAARVKELQSEAQGLQLRLGYIAVQECKLAVERQRILEALLAGEREYAELTKEPASPVAP